ncbi:MAG: hypothetical protein HC831_00555 [Chloroflexia bacterium]|nr:hypothetical protein [Chloroflexia bacterium]
MHKLLSPEVFLKDIELQFTHEEYELCLNTKILSLNDLDFDAIYVATGKDGNNFGLFLEEERRFATTKQGVFIGGSIIGADTMQAISHGLDVSSAIEGYLKTGKMNHWDEPQKGTKLSPDAIKAKQSVPVFPANGTNYTKEEAIAEANRCEQCACNACVKHSPLMSYFKKFPKRITEEVEVTITPSSLDGEATLATRLISTCNQCGLCKEVCPKDIDTGEFLLKSHHAMKEKGKMPWAFHEFFLRDMAFSNTEAALTKIPTGFEKSEYVFFPGCQLGASDPQLVIKSYRFLKEYFPDTALMLNCCGTAADWAGEGLFTKQ